MVFSSILFLTRFFPLVLAIYFAVPKKGRNLVLFIASLIFYAWGEPKYLFLMLFTIAIDYFAALIVDRYKRAGNDRASRTALIVAVIVNLARLSWRCRGREEYPCFRNLRNPLSSADCGTYCPL